MKRLSLVVLLTLGLLLVGPSALATKPTIQEFPIDLLFLDESCGFPIEVQITGFIIHIEWIDAGGSLRVFEAGPQIKMTLTNLDTGETLTSNIAGPAHITEGSDGSFTFVGTGTWSWNANPETGEPGIFVSAGRWVFAVDSEGNESFTIVGKIFDLCPELAP